MDGGECFSDDEMITGGGIARVGRVTVVVIFGEVAFGVR